MWEFSGQNLKMQRQFCVKLLSKIAGNASRINTNSISAKSVSASSVLKTNLNPVYQQSLSQHSTLSNGFSWSSIRSRMFFSNTLLKGQSKSPVHGYASRFFHSFDSQYRGWYFVLLFLYIYVLMLFRYVLVSLITVKGVAIFFFFLVIISFLDSVQTK